MSGSFIVLSPQLDWTWFAWTAVEPQQLEGRHQQVVRESSLVQRMRDHFWSWLLAEMTSRPGLSLKMGPTGQKSDELSASSLIDEFEQQYTSRDPSSRSECLARQGSLVHGVDRGEEHSE